MKKTNASVCGLTIDKLLPLIHFLASFLYERSILLFRPEKNTVAAYAKSLRYSDLFERIMGYALSKLFAAIIIFLIWKLIFYVIDNWKQSRMIRAFTWFFFLGLLCLILYCPDGFIRSADNYVTYSYAIRFFPEYWHNAYSSIMFCACLMTAPHPFAISVIQWLAFVFDLAYLWHRLDECPKVVSKAKWFSFLIFALPGTIVMITDPYRTEIYALLCIYYVTVILFDVAEGKQFSARRLVFWAFLSALVAVWRSEGIILGGLGFIAILLFANRCKLKQVFLFAIVFVIAFEVTSFPQKVGMEKYYGSDYSIINSFPFLHNVLNREDSNFSYDGAKEDLAAIEAVVPIEVIQAYGMDGYRRYNYLNGNKDINQSVAPMELGKAYVKAYYRIVLHNPVTYVRTQLGMLKVVLRLRTEEYVEGSRAVLSRDYPSWEFQAWADGKEDFFSYPGVQSWSDWSARKAFADGMTNLVKTLEQFFIKIYLVTFLVFLIPFLDGVIFLREVIAFLRMPRKEKNLQSLFFAFMTMMLLGQFAAIALVMPAGILYYFSAVYFCSFALQCLYFGKWLCDRKTAKDHLGGRK